LVKNVLGITGRTRDAAAALAVDGRIVAAATEDSFARVPGIGYELTGGFPHAAVQACLSVAGLEPGDVGEVVVVDDLVADAGAQQGNGRSTIDVPRRTMTAVEADALQAAMSDPGSATIVVCGAQPPVLASFARQGDGLGPRMDVPGARGLVDAARTLAWTLGVDAGDPFASLDRLSVGAEPEYRNEIGKAIRWTSSASGVAVEPAALVDAIGRSAGEHAAGLADARSLNARVQHARRALAASFTFELANVVARVAEQAGNGHGSRSISLGGGMFANARFNTELARVMGPGLSFAAVPEAFGRALGAVGSTPGAIDAGLALGPNFSEEDIKRTLDNCRLDYVYEPVWTRLLTRVSRMLAQGKVIGWFQGAMAFGPRAMGTRSILVDPSNKYARQNLNEYLRQVPLDEPLPLAVAPSLADRCFSGESSPARGVFDAEVRPEWRQSLAAALDWRHAARVHGLSRAQAPSLCDLLELHHATTGTPGLIEANLAGPGEPVACTPRDAVRTVYSSAIDALVMGRFLLMKDYWLLRTQDK
jgi:carbamoyltransferase